MLASRISLAQFRSPIFFHPSSSRHHSLRLSITPRRNLCSSSTVTSVYRRSVHPRDMENKAVVKENEQHQQMHIAGKWFSVPDLRLRDHRFIVPLDYSSSSPSSPNISIFAREVVSGLFQLGRKNNHCHIYCSFREDQGLKAHGQLKLVDG